LALPGKVVKMMFYSIPDILVTVIRSKNGLLDLDIQPYGFRGIRVRSRVSEGKLLDKNKALQEKLYEIRGDLDSIDRLSWQHVDKSLRDIDIRGHQFIHLLFRDDLVKVQKVFRRAMRGLNGLGGIRGYAGWDCRSQRIPSVEIRSRPEHSIPFEIMPILDLSPMPVIDSRPELAKAAMRFPGFAMAISRSVERRDRMWAGPIECPGRLPLKYFCDAKLPGVNDEIGYLSIRLKKEIEFDGPWPDDSVMSKEFADILWSHLVDPRRSFLGRDHAVGPVFHFSCHCDQDGDSSEDCLLTFGSRGNKQEFRVRLGELISRHVRSSLNRVRSEDLPLLFLNACGSAAIAPSGVAELVDFFLGVGGGGAIGCIASMPSRFASWFTKAFYRHFVNGHNLGESLYKAKWQLLSRKRNPLGILYVAYANSRMEVNFGQPGNLGNRNGRRRGP